MDNIAAAAFDWSDCTTPEPDSPSTGRPRRSRARRHAVAQRLEPQRLCRLRRVQAWSRSSTRAAPPPLSPQPVGQVLALHLFHELDRHLHEVTDDVVDVAPVEPNLRELCRLHLDKRRVRELREPLWRSRSCLRGTNRKNTHFHHSWRRRVDGVKAPLHGTLRSYHIPSARSSGYFSAPPQLSIPRRVTGGATCSADAMATALFAASCPTI